MNNAHYAFIMLSAGIGIPVLAALNAKLGRFVESPASASVVLFAVAFGAAIIATLLMGAGNISKFATAPKHLFLAGILVAFYVLSITYIAPHFGLGNAVFFVLLGQLISAAVIDHFGLFGAVQTPISLLRGTGLGVIALGVFLTQLALR